MPAFRNSMLEISLKYEYKSRQNLFLVLESTLFPTFRGKSYTTYRTPISPSRRARFLLSMIN